MSFVQAVQPSAADIPAETVAPDFAHKVYVKAVWSDPVWKLAPYLRPLSAIEHNIHGGSQATFEYDFGNAKPEDVDEFQPIAPFSFPIASDDPAPLPPRHLFVCIRAVNPVDATEYVLWVGILSNEVIDLGGTEPPESPQEDPVLIGTQTIAAHGLDHLLDRRFLPFAVVCTDEDTEDGQTVTEEINWLPTFNERDPKSHRILGNRSTAWIDKIIGDEVTTTQVSKGFSGDGELWSFLDIIDYLLFWSYHTFTTGEPRFKLDLPSTAPPSGTPTLRDFLDETFRVVQQDGRSVLDMIRELINPKRGMSAKVVWDLDDAGFPDATMPVRLQLHSLSDEDIGVDGRTLPKNDMRETVVLDSGLDEEDATITYDAANLFDRVWVQGARTVSCFSVATAALANAEGFAYCQRAWLSTTESAYAAATDAQRRRPDLERVYTTFRLGYSEDNPFNWFTTIAGSAVDPDNPLPGVWLNPTFDYNGRIVLTANGPKWNAFKGLRTELPIANVSDTIDEVAESGYLKCFAVCEIIDASGNNTGVWVMANNPPVPGEHSLDDNGRPDVSATVTALDRNLEFQVRFNPNHTLGRRRFTPSGPNAFAAQPAVFDSDRMIATVAVETDTRPVVLLTRDDDTINPFITSRTLVITVEECQVWLVAPGTVTGLQGDGQLRRHSGSQVVRDDTDILRDVAAMAKRMYLRDRASLRLKRHGLYDIHPVGTMIEGVVSAGGIRPVRTVVASRQWDFERKTITITTDVFRVEIQSL